MVVSVAPIRENLDLDSVASVLSQARTSMRGQRPVVSEAASRMHADELTVAMDGAQSVVAYAQAVPQAKKHCPADSTAKMVIQNADLALPADSTAKMVIQNADQALLADSKGRMGIQTANQDFPA